MGDAVARAGWLIRASNLWERVYPAVLLPLWERVYPAMLLPLWERVYPASSGFVPPVGADSLRDLGSKSSRSNPVPTKAAAQIAE